MKILIIGQAPPYQKQEVPYDTTMLYEWFNDVGIDKNTALQMFDFDAVSNKFPGFTETGGHKVPSKEDMDAHYRTLLKYKIEQSDKIIVLGAVAWSYLSDKINTKNKKILKLMHPSTRNRALYNKNKTQIIEQLKSILN